MFKGCIFFIIFIIVKTKSMPNVLYALLTFLKVFFFLPYRCDAFFFFFFFKFQLLVLWNLGQWALDEPEANPQANYVCQDMQ